jgi:hypothetical protein
MEEIKDPEVHTEAAPASEAPIGAQPRSEEALAEPQPQQAAAAPGKGSQALPALLDPIPALTAQLPAHTHTQHLGLTASTTTSSSSSRTASFSQPVGVQECGGPLELIQAVEAYVSWWALIVFQEALNANGEAFDKAALAPEDCAEMLVKVGACASA